MASKARQKRPGSKKRSVQEVHWIWVSSLIHCVTSSEMLLPLCLINGWLAQVALTDSSSANTESVLHLKSLRQWRASEYRFPAHTQQMPQA